MKVKDLYWEAANMLTLINRDDETRPLLCEPRLTGDSVVIRLWLRDLDKNAAAGGAIAMPSRDEATALADAIDDRRNWIGEKIGDMPRIGVSVTKDSTAIRFMECEGAGHAALSSADAERLAAWLHDMADGVYRDHNGYKPRQAVTA